MAAAWSVEIDGDSARLVIRALTDVPPSSQDAIRTEGLGLLRLLHAGARHEVVLR